jgi:hypothetical protein
MVVCLSIDPDLNVETEQLQTVTGAAGLLVMIRNEAWAGGILRDRGGFLHHGGTAFLNEVVSS